MTSIDIHGFSIDIHRELVEFRDSGGSSNQSIDLWTPEIMAKITRKSTDQVEIGQFRDMCFPLDIKLYWYLYNIAVKFAVYRIVLIFI